ncbi:MarR family winged helix-turn-helix transcriptional regulator [Streptomyces sp. NPDC057245]|uniref:MarR family winged helix-turn-helix transcriptional regulator n=1 Tax=Streptomyces TaxID=1883 RepID=UPI001C1E86AB|nr:MarR family transcriptional regulator [Streptomyces sp. A108]MBU6529832.1 MarR family transcriptional regulator [Streptomyces sp. A108]
MAQTAAEELAAGRLGHTIKRAEQALISRKTRALREFDLTVPQYSILLLLSVSDGMSAAQLARECLVTPQTVATVLTNLEKTGLIAREPSKLHQKVVVNRITRSGRAVARKADKAALQVEAALGSAFEPEERERFEKYLERAIATLTELD